MVGLGGDSMSGWPQEAALVPIGIMMPFVGAILRAGFVKEDEAATTSEKQYPRPPALVQPHTHHLRPSTFVPPADRPPLSCRTKRLVCSDPLQVPNKSQTTTRKTTAS